MTPSETMNRAFTSDPDAIHALMVNRVPCNQKLADDPTVVVDKSMVNPNGWSVGVVGLINGILGDLGLPLLASKWSDEVDAEGRHTLLGFQEYQPPSPPSET